MQVIRWTTIFGSLEVGRLTQHDTRVFPSRIRLHMIILMVSTNRMTPITVHAATVFLREK